MKTAMIVLALLGLLLGCSEPESAPENATGDGEATVAGHETETEQTGKKIVKTDEEWRSQLTDLQYYVTREKGTEAPGTGEYNHTKTAGTYLCVCCGAELFSSETKYDSGCGWPAFYAPLLDGNVEFTEDRSHGMVRTEVTCARCGAHLGHVFDDGPPPTGQRFCINSASLKLREKSAEK
jgi:peptide-methionine (R)-S-oxide reductase